MTCILITCECVGGKMGWCVGSHCCDVVKSEFREMLNSFQVFVGTIKRYVRKPKTVEFYWNSFAFGTFCTFSAFVFFDQEFFSNVFPKNKGLENENEKKSN